MEKQKNAHRLVQLALLVAVELVIIRDFIR